MVKVMVQQDLCRQCNQRHDCEKVYEQLGKFDGPSVVRKVVLAFLMPLVVFTVSLAIFEKIFSTLLNDGQFQSAISFVSAFLLTFVCVLMTRLISVKFSQDK